MTKENLLTLQAAARAAWRTYMDAKVICDTEYRTAVELQISATLAWEAYMANQAAKADSTRK